MKRIAIACLVAASLAVGFLVGRPEPKPRPTPEERSKEQLEIVTRDGEPAVQYVDKQGRRKWLTARQLRKLEAVP